MAIPIISAPRDIGVLNQDYTDRELAKLKKLLIYAGKSKYIGTHNRASLYEVASGSTRYIFMSKDGEVLYFVKHSIVKSFSFAPIRQVLLCRLEYNLHTTGLPKHVFFDILLPRYGSIVTDTQQTEKGKSFWLYACALAFKTGKYVYFVDARKKGTPLIKRVVDDADFDSYVPTIWGNSHLNERTLAVISTKLLPESS